MSYIPLNNNNFQIGDRVVCIENRFARVFDHRTGFRAFGNELMSYLTLKQEYEVLAKDDKRRKVKILSDDGSIKNIPYYRLGVKEEED